MYIKRERPIRRTTRSAAPCLFVASFVTVGALTIFGCAIDALAVDHVGSAKGREPLKVLADSSLDINVRFKVFNELLSLEGKNRTDALCRVIETSDDGEFGVYAVNELLKEDKLSGDLLHTVSDTCVNWDVLHRRTLLQALAYAHEPQRFHIVAKTLLEALLSTTSQMQATSSDLVALAGDSCAILCRRGSCPSKQLVLNVLKSFPTSPKAWFSAACGGVLDEEVSTLAVSVYKDPVISPMTRLAAASAIASRDNGAQAYVLNELDAFFARYVDDTVGDIMGESIYTDRDAAKRYHMFKEKLRWLEVLQCLDGELAREIVFAQISANNERIRNVLLLVGAKRWPEQLVTFLEDNSQIQVNVKILALITVENKTLSNRCYRLGNEAAIRKESNELRKSNPAAFFGADGAFIRGL